MLPGGSLYAIEGRGLSLLFCPSECLAQPPIWRWCFQYSLIDWSAEIMSHRALRGPQVILMPKINCFWTMLGEASNSLMVSTVLVLKPLTMIYLAPYFPGIPVFSRLWPMTHLPALACCAPRDARQLHRSPNIKSISLLFQMILTWDKAVGTIRDWLKYCTFEGSMTVWSSWLKTSVCVSWGWPAVGWTTAVPTLGPLLHQASTGSFMWGQGSRSSKGQAPNASTFQVSVSYLLLSSWPKKDTAQTRTSVGGYFQSEWR